MWCQLSISGMAILFQCLTRGRWCCKILSAQDGHLPLQWFQAGKIAISMPNSIDLNAWTLSLCWWSCDEAQFVVGWTMPLQLFKALAHGMCANYERLTLTWLGGSITIIPFVHPSNPCMTKLPMFPLDIFCRTWGTKPGTGKWKVMTWCCSQWDTDALCHTNHDEQQLSWLWNYLWNLMKQIYRDLQWFPSTKARSLSTATQWHTLHHAKPSLQPGQGLKLRII